LREHGLRLGVEAKGKSPLGRGSLRGGNPLYRYKGGGAGTGGHLVSELSGDQLAKEEGMHLSSDEKRANQEVNGGC